jgi:hypothetical protein
MKIDDAKTFLVGPFYSIFRLITIPGIALKLDSSIKAGPLPLAAAA